MAYNFQSLEGKKRKAGERYAHKTNKSTYSWRGAVYPINNGDSGEYLCYTDLLSRMLEIINWGLDKYRRVYIVRYDLRVSVGCKLPSISNAHKNIVRSLERKYGKVAYFWVREIERAKELHYHCFVVCDGDKVRSTGINSGVFSVINRLWRAEGGSQAHLCTTSTFVDSNQTMNKAIFAVSYLAKARGKAYLSSDKKNYSCSQIKKRGQIKPFRFDERVDKTMRVTIAKTAPVGVSAVG